MEREKLGSRLGFILLSAGCAIGIGNVWKFPYVAGIYGGGVFLLFYVLFLILLGIPVLTMEFAMGRAAGTSPMHMYQNLEKKGQKWHLHAPVALAGNWLLMMFYTVVCGWMVRYFVESLKGTFSGASPEQIQTTFDGMLGQAGQLYIYTGLCIVVAFAVCAAGLQNGLERISKGMMLALLILMAVLAIRCVFLPGGIEGVKYLFIPDWDRAFEMGIGNVLMAAMNQSFFSLSIGMGSMAIFGSYIEKDKALFSESMTVAGLDTFVAVMAGLIILPSCFAFGVPVAAGPSLIFVTLPNIFAHMPYGSLWGGLFFLFLTFAAFSTVLAVFENINSCSQDLWNWNRKKASVINCLLMLVLCIPCVLGFNVLKDIAPLGTGTTILDFEDFLVSNLILPIGSLIFVIFCTWDFGWGWKNFRTEANLGKGIHFPEWLHPYCKYVLPIVILTVLVTGLV